MNSYTGPDPIFQTDEQLIHTVLLRDADSARPITSHYEGLYNSSIMFNRYLSKVNIKTGPGCGAPHEARGQSAALSSLVS